MARQLTEKQKRVLDTLEAYWYEHQVPPSISDLAKDLGINKATAYEHLLALKKKGYLVHQPKAGRTWRLINTSQKPCTHVEIPVISQLIPGTLPWAMQNIERYIVSEYSKDSGDFFALRVTNDSMIKANIKENDIAIIKRQSSAINNDIVVATIDKEAASIRRFESNNTHARLISENDRHPSLEVDLSRVVILGKVIEVRRLFL